MLSLENILMDPMILLELCALLFCLCFLAKAIFLTSANTISESELKYDALTIQKNLSSTNVSGFSTLIEVGSLISLPKTSLKCQRLFV